MAKINIDEIGTTKTASSGEKLGNRRGESPSRVEVVNNVGVKMDSKDRSTKEKAETKPMGDTAVKVNGVKKETKKPAAKTIIVATEDVYDKKTGTERPVAKPRGAKTEKGLAVRERQVDPEIALMASRAASAERAKPDVVKVYGGSQSMSGMIGRPTRRRANTAYSVNAQRDKIRTQITEKKEAEATESQFSKFKSALIGVGVALVVAVIGFAGIAIFGSNKKMCAVNFESNGGSKVAGAEIVCGRTVTEPDNPSKEGFSFDGWILEGDPFDFSTGIYKNATLVAKWKANEDTEIVTVKFDSDGGTKVDNIEVAKGKTLTRPTAPTKVGYVFDDWYLGDKVYDFKSPVTADITLKAKWEKRQTTTASNNNGSSSSNNNAKPNNRVTSLTVSDLTIEEGKSVHTNIIVVPSAAEYELIIVADYDDSIARCSINGTTLACEGKKAGSTHVRIKDRLTGNSDDVTVIVTTHTHVYQGDKCTICGEIDPEHWQHDYVDGACTICGAKHTEHLFGEDGKGETCSVCGVKNPNHDHNHSGAGGTCTICGELKTEHSYVDGVCTQCGEKDPNYTGDGEGDGDGGGGDDGGNSAAVTN